VILPEQNKKDYLEEVPPEIREKLDVHFVKHAEQVLKLALEKQGAAALLGGTARA
jgi:ATP-dependent Lon protease